MARKSTKSRSKGSGTRGSAPARSTGAVSRPKVVWASLVAGMTLVGGVLWALDGSALPRNEGLALPALVSTSRVPADIDVVFNTRQPLDTERWNAIAIYHSGSSYGSADSIEDVHRSRGLQGLGYHFVVGNGNGSEDGELHVGYRWLNQVPGAHAVGDGAEDANQRAISICWVGNGDRQGPTPAQMSRLIELSEALAERFNLPRERIMLQQAPGSGKFFPAATFLGQLNAR
ncbi:MAG: peptidoglycan recognition family protein [Planctomycetota bacterium]|nr:peptidoglycan recognition family protein [Planctomycetota bacterium]